MGYKARIALIHKDSLLCRRIGRSLTRSGFDVFRAIGRSDGLPLIYEVRPDLVLLELTESDQDAQNTFSSIRLMSDIPIILLAQRPPDPASFAIMAGASVLTLPVSATRIISVVRLVLGASRPPAEKARGAKESVTGGEASFPADSREILQPLAWLQALLKRIKHAQTLDQAVDQLSLEHLLTVLGADWLALFLYGSTTPSEGPSLRPRWTAGSAAWTKEQSQFLADMVIQALNTEHVLVFQVPPCGKELPGGSVPQTPGSGNMVIVPLQGHDQLLGALAVRSRGGAEGALVPTRVRLITTVAETFALVLDSMGLVQPVHASAVRDEATGLYSHLYVESVIRSRQQRSEGYGRPVSVVQLDCVNAQEYREAHGQAEWSRTLRHIASVCQNQVRSSDVVARYAGESIALVLPEVDPVQAQRVADRLGRSVQASFADKTSDAPPEIVMRVIAVPSTVPADNGGRNEISGSDTVDAKPRALTGTRAEVG